MSEKRPFLDGKTKDEDSALRALEEQDQELIRLSSKLTRVNQGTREIERQVDEHLALTDHLSRYMLSARSAAVTSTTRLNTMIRTGGCKQFCYIFLGFLLALFLIRIIFLKRNVE
ncbi:hypothetical protein GEMRC1_011793 [Eukaryota sp. GEM-RC1]